MRKMRDVYNGTKALKSFQQVLANVGAGKKGSFHETQVTVLVTEEDGEISIRLAPHPDSPWPASETDGFAALTPGKYNVKLTAWEARK